MAFLVVVAQFRDETLGAKYLVGAELDKKVSSEKRNWNEGRFISFDLTKFKLVTADGSTKTAGMLSVDHGEKSSLRTLPPSPAAL